jgi:hypothetical protein
VLHQLCLLLCSLLVDFGVSYYYCPQRAEETAHLLHTTSASFVTLLQLSSSWLGGGGGV